MTHSRKMAGSTHPLDLFWSLDTMKATMLSFPVIDEIGRLVIDVDADASSFKPDVARGLAQHLASIHNGWLERQRHLDRESRDYHRR